MKRLSIALYLTTLSCTALAEDDKTRDISFEGDMRFVHFCKAVVRDDVSMLKRALALKVGEVAANRRGVLQKLLSSQGMTCNGQDLVRFSLNRDAKAVYAYLSGQ